MKTFLGVSSMILLGMFGCQKEKNPLDTLPEATQTGAGTVGWLQDGRAYQPTTDAFNSRAVIVSRFSDGTMDFLFVHNQAKHNRYIILNVRKVRAPGRYLFNEVARPSFPNTTPAYANYSTSNPEPSAEYLTGPTATGQLTVTRLDSVAKIISGTFEFTAQKTSGEGPETVRLTNGRFDLQYQP
ncbi:hypothetical protein H8B13_13405 [Hymenobacter sp. BT188]|uniref:DUF6252 family protein n=1 Tax=Hymenobacter sp. BT188 TaxID=2763504 RepID=UPI001650F0DA|nr:DUF6252 family protein [Hymenobacter sp. BT188]MBC6607817.1 hypothetical protein [Hymenobacter sp. BT188]